MGNRIRRLRMRLAWIVAPASTRRYTWGQLEAIQRSAEQIEKRSVQPPYTNGDAQSIQRRVRTVKKHLCLDDGNDND
jgi:hypothetical protein